MQENKINTQEILRKLGIEALKPMQEKCIEAWSENDDIILLSPTGSGKTLAFLLPLLNQLDENKNGVQALILAPSRELAIQIESVFKSLSTPFKVNCCYGGHAMKIEKNSLSTPPAVLIGTPGRIADHLRRENFSPDSINTIILDEFDKSLELGFHREMGQIIEQLEFIKKRILTSATKSESIPEFTGVTNPFEINFLVDTPKESLVEKIVRAEGKDKLAALFNLICHNGNEATLVFCNHRDTVDRISDLLKDSHLQHDTFHGGLKQEDREKALIKFRNGSHQILITTDLASRGLDIPSIKHVIHYQLPTTADAYTHRNGRTARMDASGCSYFVMADSDYLPEFINKDIEELIIPDNIVLPEDPEWLTIYIDAGKKDKINKMDIVGCFMKKGELGKDELGKVEVLDHASFVAIKRNLATQILRKLKDERIKKKKVKMAVSY
ncbi:DEAD/DEAH box helicase [Ancylomarina sp.]|uniref:DEAD/DEAH box helicase n=1 Tax=Ancylomarina sp. TaxID=1970196 RepID=UPI00356197A1